ncbi:hypothetical protein N7495_006961 [Penicillium taxi]|uniref:uncharacterized protein n=1 Tax=Penicillium taxi TaxID=168475 RepID=UPI002544E4D1|nr:uncharacterized protein N7495_006961 [Penicillium taxi]KAJ5895270.1 hypothetical protein N7495_006961 [Penicillium taxi]
MRFLFLTVLCTVLLLGVMSSAWPWDSFSGLALRDKADALLAKRAETTATDSTETTASDSNTATTDTASNTDETATGTATGTNSATDGTTGTATGTETGTTTETGKKTTETGKTTKTTSSISIDPAAADGGISMITPASSSTTYYKIGQDITFVWNYTSLSVTPSGIDVIASCSVNKNVYTLTQNMSVAPTGTFIWDTDKYQSSATIPLLTSTYTLFVYDAQKAYTDVGEAGYLSSQVGYSFGMYIPQSYTPLNEFKCATCSGALSDIQRQGLTFALGMAFISVASFTWFAGTFGLFSL